MASDAKHVELVEALVAQFNLNDTIKAALLDASAFSIENHKKQGHLLKVTGKSSTGAPFSHNVMWTRSK